MHFSVFCFIFVIACLAQLYSSEEKTKLEMKSDKFEKILDKTGDHLDISKPIPMEDYKTLQIFKYFVYPTKYTNTMFNNTIISRNITLDKINYQPLKNVSIKSKENLSRLIDEQLDYRQNIPNNYYNYDGDVDYGRLYGQIQPQQGFQPNFLNQGNSMIHLVDPLFLMATLAFVVFLVNSILGLVNKLNLGNLPILGSSRNKFLNEVDDFERDRNAVDEIENLIKNALFEFKKHFN